MDHKIFLISFNKCATTTFQYFMETNGVPSVHWMDKHKIHIAKKMMSNIESNENILKGINDYTAYSELSYWSPSCIIEPFDIFEELYKQYPTSKYIFFDRPVEDWIESRINHGLMIRYKKRYKLNNKDDIEKRWSDDYKRYKSNIMIKFEGKSNFLHYNIMNDDIQKLIDFLPEYKLNRDHWIKKNVTKNRNK